MALEIITNNVSRETLCYWDLTEKEKKEFDWLKDDESNYLFFRYRGQVYCLDNFMSIGNNKDLKGWHGYTNDTYFSGVLVKFVGNDSDYVIVGRYFVKSDY